MVWQVKTNDQTELAIAKCWMGMGKPEEVKLEEVNLKKVDQKKVDPKEVEDLKAQIVAMHKEIRQLKNSKHANYLKIKQMKQAMNAETAKSTEKDETITFQTEQLRKYRADLQALEEFTEETGTFEDDGDLWSDDEVSGLGRRLLGESCGKRQALLNEKLVAKCYLATMVLQ